MKTVRLGDEGIEVIKLQTLLMREGMMISPAGKFDESTKKIVSLFQEQNGLKPDGIVGYETWEALMFKGQVDNIELTDNSFTLVAELLDVEPAVLKAVQQVETGGRGGFFAPGKPAILFEAHIFWNELKKRGINPGQHVQGNETILCPRWTKGNYKGGIAEYDRLEQARKIDKEAADASTSWGMFQIMGFNYAACGERNIENFVKAMCAGELSQLLLSARFIKRSNMIHALQTKNWEEFAKRYNGPAYAENCYDKKLADAYRRFT